MKNYKLQGSLFIEAIFSFFILSIISLVFISQFTTIEKHYKEQLRIIEIKKEMLTALNHFTHKELQQGVNFHNSQIKLISNRYCAKYIETNEKVCLKY